MRKIEVKLSLPVVAPLVEVIRGAVEDLEGGLAVNLEMEGNDPELEHAWRGDLLKSQNSDCRLFVALFNESFFETGRIEFDEEQGEAVVRACAAIRLRLRQGELRDVKDSSLETGEIDFSGLTEEQQQVFTCYLFLVTLQELIIQNLDPNSAQA